MECADQILARTGVDRSLAAHAAIDLRQQAGGELHEIAAALGDGGGKSGQIADHAAAQRQNMIAALHAAIEQPVEQPFQPGPTLGAFALRHGEQIERDIAGGQTLFQRFQPMRGHAFIGHADQPAGAGIAGQMRADIIECAGRDQDVIGRARQIDRDPGHAAIACKTAPTVRSWGAFSLCT